MVPVNWLMTPNMATMPVRESLMTRSGGVFASARKLTSQEASELVEKAMRSYSKHGAYALSRISDATTGYSTLNYFSSTKLRDKWLQKNTDKRVAIGYQSAIKWLHDRTLQYNLQNPESYICRHVYAKGGRRNEVA